MFSPRTFVLFTEILLSGENITTLFQIDLVESG